MKTELIEDYHECKTCNLFHNKLETYIIKDVKWDEYDHIGYAWSITFSREGSEFFLFFKDINELSKLLKASKVKKVEDLIGKPCYCYEENKSGKFHRMWNL
jgi:GH18 family chitinase